MGRSPGLEGLDGGSVVERFLWEMLVVEPDVAMQGCLQVSGAVEVVGAQDLRLAAVEALEHTVGA